MAPMSLPRLQVRPLVLEWECGGIQSPETHPLHCPHSHGGAPVGWGCGLAGGAQRGAGPAGLETWLPAGLGRPSVKQETGHPSPTADPGSQHVCSTAALVFRDLLRACVRGKRGRIQGPEATSGVCTCLYMGLCGGLCIYVVQVQTLVFLHLHVQSPCVGTYAHVYT